MAAMKNIALYVDSNCEVSVQRDFPIPKPESGELLVEVLFSGVNPADLKHATLLRVRPEVMGLDFCGRILDSPALPDTTFKVGDLIAGYTETGIGRPDRYGTHQSYMAIPPKYIFKVPKHMPPSDAAALLVVLQTANDALFNRFLLPLPSANPAPLDGTLVIWGGATAVGVCAIQLARCTGLKSIIAIASPSRHELLKSLGATRCFDYNSSTVITDIKAELQQVAPGSIFGFDAAGASPTDGKPSSGQLLGQAVSDWDEVRLVSVVPQQDKRYDMALASRDYDTTFHFPGTPAPTTIPARLEEGERMWEAVKWVVDNYGTEFRLPAVEVFDGSAEEALDEIKKIGDLGRFGKLVFKHPLQ